MAGDLTVYQGTSLHVVFDVTDDAGAPFPLTTDHYTAAAMQVRPRSGSDVLLLSLTTGSGITIEPGGAVGQVHVDAGADLTGAMTRGGVYDCLAWNPADLTDVILIASGKVTLTKRVTVT